MFENEDTLDSKLINLLELLIVNEYKKSAKKYPRLDLTHAGAVLKYLRDFHQIFISINFNNYKWFGDLHYPSPTSNRLTWEDYDQEFDTYESCVEFLIIKALEKI